MYKLYANSKTKGWQLLNTNKSISNIQKIISEEITPKKYYSYMIKQCNENGEQIIFRRDFTRECQVEFVDNLKTSVEVKATMFKPSKMKKKEELRKMTEEYLKE